MKQVEEHPLNLHIFLKGCEKALDELVNKGFEWRRQRDQEEEGNSVCCLLCHCCATSSSQAHRHEAAASETVGGEFALLTRLSLSVRICSSLHDFGCRVTGGYCCQQGLVFQKGRYHATPWKWVLQPQLWRHLLHPDFKNKRCIREEQKIKNIDEPHATSDACGPH